MKYLIIFFLLISSLGFSQEIEDLLKSRKFVIEASKITDDEGNANAASRKLCFILIDTTRIIVQWMANCDNNGLGGITLDGEIESFILSTNKSEKETQHLLDMACNMDDGRVKSEIKVEIYDRSHANATLSNQTTSIFIPEQMKFLGRLVPLQDSNVIIGSE